MPESRPITDILRRRPPMQFSAIADSAVLQKACAAVLARWPDKAHKKSPDDAEAVLRRIYQFVQGWQAEWQTEKLPMAVIRSGVIYAFAEAGEYPKIEIQIFIVIREFLLEELKYDSSVSFVTAMAASYLENYAPSRPDMQRLAQALSAAIGKLEARGEFWKWQKFFRLFPQALGSENCAPQIAEALAGAENPRQVLREECGLRIAGSAMIMRDVNDAYIEAMKPHLIEIAAVKSVLRWLSEDGSREKAQQNNAASALEALIAPWLNKEPPENIQALLLEKLIKFYGDPRLTKGGVWATVGEKYKYLLIRWLTKENMLFFLQVVSQVEDSHMWMPRRKFWLGLYDAGLIDGAWVGFSEEARRVAMRLKDVQSGRDFGIQYQRQNTSILLMQIGDALVVEGSHNYKVQIFERGNKQTPALYRPRYYCEEIRTSHSSQNQIMHYASGIWRDKVLDRLWTYNRHNKTGDLIDKNRMKLLR